MTEIRSKRRVCVLVPAYNEELLLPSTLQAIKDIVSPVDIYVVDDGSIDRTSEVAKNFTANVLTTSNHGKAHALNTGLEYFDLPNAYEYILFMDADTQPDKEFLNVTMPIFEKDTDKKINLVVGRVKSYGDSWIEKYRMWEYQISHYVHKQAQALISAIIVVPGCATIYRSSVFEKLKFPTGTLTEDMDFTFLLHRKGYNGMVFAGGAVVYTQDPNNLEDFKKQIIRWYTGFWQAVKKHNIPWEGQALDLEVGMLALEGLYNGFLASLLLFFLPSLILYHSVGILKYPLILDVGLFFIPSLIWTADRAKDPKLILYIFHFYFLRFLSSLIFLICFFESYISKEKTYSWDTRRYLLRR